MKISHLSVRNYRCLKSLELNVADYTALVGANGAGKSSVLYALDWFFHGHDLNESDLTQEDGAPMADHVQVTVTFSDLTPWDRRRLGEYGRGDAARFRRTWIKGVKETNVVGRALQGDGFDTVRQASGVTAMRSAYRSLQAQTQGLPGLAGNAPKNDILAALAAWEDQMENRGRLVEVSDVDATHMFGFNGTNVFRECMRLVLVPAATDMPNQLSDAGKGSVLSELIGAVISDAGARARDEWLVQNNEAIEDLNRRVRAEVESSIAKQTGRVNAKLKEMIPEASVGFVPTVPDWVPRGDASVATSVTIDGSANEIGRQGHGIQRAVMIALFQSLVPDRPVKDASVDAARAPSDRTESGPSLVICIEEPEIYQHPTRARSFARVLSALAVQPGAQVLLATHSPYFVSPSQFDSIRRFRMSNGATVPSTASTSEVMIRARADEDSVRKTVQKRVPTTFSEGFFADAVVLVEGDTDRAVIESLAIRLDSPLDERGISLLELGGKNGLRVPYAIFDSLDIPVYIVADGDADGAARKYARQEQATDRDSANRSHKSSTEKLTTWLPPAKALQGDVPYLYASPSVISDRYVIWRDDLESELENWPSFISALEKAGGALRQKNVLAYRAAVLEADMLDLPQTLRNAIGAIAKFAAI